MARATLTTRVGIGADRTKVEDNGTGTLWSALQFLPCKPHERRTLYAVGMFAQVMHGQRVARRA